MSEVAIVVKTDTTLLTVLHLADISKQTEAKADQDMEQDDENASETLYCGKRKCRRRIESDDEEEKESLLQDEDETLECDNQEEKINSLFQDKDSDEEKGSPLGDEGGIIESGNEEKKESALKDEDEDETIELDKKAKVKAHTDKGIKLEGNILILINDY